MPQIDRQREYKCYRVLLVIIDSDCVRFAPLSEAHSGKIRRFLAHFSLLRAPADSPSMSQEARTHNERGMGRGVVRSQPSSGCQIFQRGQRAEEGRNGPVVRRYGCFNIKDMRLSSVMCLVCEKIMRKYENLYDCSLVRRFRVPAIPTTLYSLIVQFFTVAC